MKDDITMAHILYETHTIIRSDKNEALNYY